MYNNNLLIFPILGHIDLMKKHYKDINWSSYDLPNVLKERGVDDPDKLPGFHYRDDALRLWQAINDFVKRLLSIYYKSDEDIKRVRSVLSQKVRKSWKPFLKYTLTPCCLFSQQDTELQAWIEDIHNNGYTVREGEADHGFPSCVASSEQLANLLTIVIFTYSCQHAAVNFSMMDVYGFSPNAPTLMRQPPPTEKGKLTMEDVMKSLPNQHHVGVAIATVYDLTRIFPDEVRNI